MNRPDIHEVNGKIQKVRTYLESAGYDAMIIGRQDNFAWITDGGNNRVIIPSEYGFSLIVITKFSKYLVSQVMDGPRVMEEELSGLGFEYIPLRWYECTREERALELVKGTKVISDMPLTGVDFLPQEIYKLHYPMTQHEIQKLLWLGEKSEEILTRTANQIQPGVTEYEVEAMLISEYSKHNIYADVLLVGSGDRIAKYRHPNPSDKRINGLVLLHSAVRKWGLHANVTRLVYFGDKLPHEIDHKYYAACTIEAASIALSSAGNRFSDILVEQKNLYQALGFEDEWRNHYQGGVTGYMVADPALCSDPIHRVQINQPFDWFITITGVKVEELSINMGPRRKIASVTGQWPVKSYSWNGQTLLLPQILMK